MLAFRVFSLIILVAALSGCNAQPPYWAEPPFWHYSTEKFFQKTITVASGTIVLVDCTRAGEYLLQPTQAPTLGWLETIESGPYPVLRAKNTSSRCIARGAPATAIVYRIPHGAFGTDVFSYDIFASSGWVAHHYVTVQIR